MLSAHLQRSWQFAELAEGEVLDRKPWYPILGHWVQSDVIVSWIITACLQVPEMPEGGKYPDPLNQPMSEKMSPGPENTKVHGTRPEADLLDVDVERTIKSE